MSKTWVGNLHKAVSLTISVDQKPLIGDNTPSHPIVVGLLADTPVNVATSPAPLA